MRHPGAGSASEWPGGGKDGQGQRGKGYSKRVRKGQGRAKTGKGCECGSKDVKDGYEKKEAPAYEPERARCRWDLLVKDGSRTAAAYSPALTGSTIGDGGLNFSVRDGKRWDPASIAAFIRHGGTVHRCPRVCGRKETLRGAGTKPTGY